MRKKFYVFKWILKDLKKKEIIMTQDNIGEIYWVSNLKEKKWGFGNVL